MRTYRQCKDKPSNLEYDGADAENPFGQPSPLPRKAVARQADLDTRLKYYLGGVPVGFLTGGMV